MKKLSRMVRNLSPVLGSLAVFTAIYGGIRPACTIMIYQPKAPKCLK